MKKDFSFLLSLSVWVFIMLNGLMSSQLSEVRRVRITSLMTNATNEWSGRVALDLLRSGGR